MQVFLVGGAVRDKLLGRAVKDLDYVVVGSTPEKMLAAGFKQVGAEFPVFLHPKTGDEYALARRERKSGVGYHGFVCEFDPSVTLEEDLERRDLTVNAMAMDDDGNVVDPFGGQADLQARVLRPVSEAFREDPVRVLRLARFMARFGAPWRQSGPATTMAFDMLDAGEFRHLTRERVLQEVVKALSEPNWHRFFENLPCWLALNQWLDEQGQQPLGEFQGPQVGGNFRFNLDQLSRWPDGVRLLRVLGAPNNMLRQVELSQWLRCPDLSELSQWQRDSSWFNDELAALGRDDLVAANDAAMSLRFADFDDGGDPCDVRLRLEAARRDVFHQALGE